MIPKSHSRLKVWIVKFIHGWLFLLTSGSTLARSSLLWSACKNVKPPPPAWPLPKAKNCESLRHLFVFSMFTQTGHKYRPVRGWWYELGNDPISSAFYLWKWGWGIGPLTLLPFLLRSKETKKKKKKNHAGSTQVNFCIIPYTTLHLTTVNYIRVMASGRNGNWLVGGSEVSHCIRPWINNHSVDKFIDFK